MDRHVSNIFSKLGVSSRAAVTAYAYEHGSLTSLGETTQPAMPTFGLFARCPAPSATRTLRCMATPHGAPVPTQHSAGEDARARLSSGLPVTERRLLLAAEFAAVWLRVIPDLVTTHRFIAPDLPGPGASAVPDGRLDAVLEALRTALGSGGGRS